MNVYKILKEMTLEEKASLCSGSDFWHTKAVERFDIPEIMMSDGPHGLRKNKEGSENPNESITSICFPAGCATACSYNRDMLDKMGKALADACQEENVSVILGPGCNIKRSPLCGRNFEYFSEDPFLASQLAAAEIKGVQSKGIGTSLKHFACNNQETRRMSCSAEIDERTLREIYLSAFEYAVKEAKPYTIMCSYNKINGTYSSQNQWLLTDILRNEWGYDGVVVSDWGAVDYRPAGVAAGLDLEMPSSGGINDKLIVDAVNDGRLSSELLDKATLNILKLIEKAENGKNSSIKWDKDKQHTLARQIAADSAVLLKNDNNILPLKADSKIAFIGKFAESPRFQGGGSSHINAYKITSALEAAKEFCDVDYAQGYETDSDIINEELLADAVQCARNNDISVIFAGLTDSYESEGFDRKHMKMPQCQLELIKRVCEVNNNVVVVLHNGSPVEMPFINDIKGLLEMYLGGEAVGGATCDLLFGKVCPSGKLAETMPENLSDNPSYLSFPGEKDKCYYNEGIFVGYRYYDYKQIKPLFPFGFGLSYTEFEYSDMNVSTEEIKNMTDETLRVSVKVTNTGKVAGGEIVQLYVSQPDSNVIKPLRELKGFQKIYLKPGETKPVVFTLDKHSFEYFSVKIHDWFVDDGKYIISVGSSSRDIRLSESVYLSDNKKVPAEYTINSTISDILETPEGENMFSSLLAKANTQFTGGDEDLLGESSQLMLKAMMSDMPVRTLISFSNGESFDREKLGEMIDNLNNIINNKPQE